MLHDILTYHGDVVSDWMDKTKKRICCFFCSKELSIEKSNLEEHARKHLQKIDDPLCDVTLGCPISGTEPRVYNVLQSIQSKQFWKQYVPEEMCANHTQIFTPSSLVDPSSELVFITNNIFTSVELARMTEAVTWLDANGKSTKRGIHKGGSRMVTFGIRYKYGKLAWYVLLLLMFYYLLAGICSTAGLAAWACCLGLLPGLAAWACCLGLLPACACCLLLLLFYSLVGFT
jgi:hypothetical protein